MQTLSLELVTHCYRYSRLLRYQLSSLVISPPEGVDIKVTICHTPADEGTVEVLAWFEKQSPSGVRWNWQAMDARFLCRRSIGRNKAALASEADWVWFCDADYWFGPECWRRFPDYAAADAPLIFPRVVSLHKVHALGDACIEAATEGSGLIAADPNDFEPVGMSRAIGGIQIVNGSYCRENGYLANSKRFQRPTRKAGFGDFRDDVAFRRAVGVPGRGIDLPEVFRIRHTAKGHRTPNAVL